MPTGGALGSMWAATVQRPRRDDFGRAIGWYSAPAAGRAWVKRVNSLPSGRLTISVTGMLASATAAVVAQHRHELHGLAGAIDAALGIEEGVDRAGLVAARDAAVGEVERRLAELEAREILLGGVGRHHGAGARPRRGPSAGRRRK